MTIKNPVEMSDEELAVAMRTSEDALVREFAKRIRRAELVTKMIASRQFIAVADALQKAVTSTTAFKDSSPELVDAMFAYHEARMKIAKNLPKEKTT
jgi:hypothetical protein